MSSPLRVLCLGSRALEFVRALSRGVTGELDATLVEWSEAAAAEATPAGWEGADALVFCPGTAGDPGHSLLRGVRARIPNLTLLAAVSGDGEELAKGWSAVRRGFADGVLRGDAEVSGLRRLVDRAREAGRRDAAFLGDPSLLRRIWSDLTELIAVMSPDSKWVYASPAHRRVFGDPLLVEGGDLLAAIHPADREAVRRVIGESSPGAIGDPVAFRILLADGSVRHVEAGVKALDGADAGKVVLIGRDATERHQAEAGLREREEFFRRISEEMTDLVAVLDPDGRRLYNSPSYRALFGGHTPELGTDSFAEIHLEDRERIRGIFRSSVASGAGQRAEFRFVLPDGRIRYLESVGSVVRDESGQVSKVIVVSRDTTERRQAEEALSRERNLLRTLIDVLPDFIYAKDAGGRFILNNLAHARLAGCEAPAALAGLTDFDVFPPDHAARYAADDTAIVRHGMPILLREEPVQERDGRQLWVLTTKVPLRDAAGRIVGLVGMTRDITERRRVEQDLRESQERLELVIAGSRDGVWDWNVVTSEVYFSPRWKSMLGYSEREVPNTFDGWKGLLHPEDSEKSLHTLQDYFEGRVAVYELEHRLRHKDGSYRWILARGVALRDASGRPLRMAGSHVDLTERRRTEERLREAARWESVTNLAAGVAHEVKNPLQTILLGVDFLARRPGAEDPVVAGLLASMQNAAQNADTVIRALRDYALQRQPQLKSCDFNELLRESRAFLDFEFRRAAVGVQTDFAADVPSLQIDADQIKQVFWIVFRNAMDAMAGNPGRIKVASRFQEHRPDIPATVLPPPAACGWVVVTVDDSGPGVSEDVLHRVFDLFFTTKTQGKGTGIGLALARRILELHRGAIGLANLPGQGARVTVALPVLEEAGIQRGEERDAAGPAELNRPMPTGDSHESSI